MAYSFTIAQSALNPALVIATDTSTSIDPSITKRRIYFQTYSGEYLVPSGVTTDYIEWPLADVSISLDILTQDQAVNVTVQWLNVSNTVIETLSQLYCLPEFNKQFYFYLLQNIAATPPILGDATFFSNMATYWQLITGAIQAIEIGADISSSQNCLNLATNMKNNSSYYF